MYGIWNTKQKRFVFGIREITERKAFAELRKLMGDDAYRWRYEVRVIPEGFVNPPHPAYLRRS